MSSRAKKRSIEEVKSQMATKRDSKKPNIPHIEADLDVKVLGKKAAETLYLKIKKWRDKNPAVVDTLGAEAHYDEDADENEKAF
jgi:hypothetical protein